jgi:hypothetical protein
MPVSPGKKLLEASKEFSVNSCRILSANEFAPTEKTDFTQTGYTRLILDNVALLPLAKPEPQPIQPDDFF